MHLRIVEDGIKVSALATKSVDRVSWQMHKI